METKCQTEFYKRKHLKKNSSEPLLYALQIYEERKTTNVY